MRNKKENDGKKTWFSCIETRSCEIQNIDERPTVAEWSVLVMEGFCQLWKTNEHHGQSALTVEYHISRIILRLNTIWTRVIHKTCLILPFIILENKRIKKKIVKDYWVLGGHYTRLVLKNNTRNSYYHMTD